MPPSTAQVTDEYGLQPDKTVPALWRARTLLLNGEARRATRLLDWILAAEPEDAEALHLAGVAAVAEGRIAAGIESLRLAVSHSPDACWLRDLGATLILSGAYSDASLALRSSLALNPGDSEALLLLAEALVRGGEYAEALQAIDADVPLEPGARLMRLRGEAQFGAGLRREALDSLLEACDLGKVPVRIHELCAALAASLGRFDISVDHRRQALARESSDCRARGELATALWLAGEMDECVAQAGEVRAARPDNEMAHVNWTRAIDHIAFSMLESRKAWEEWGAWAASRTPKLPKPAVIWEPGRRLRIGYLTDDIHRGPNSFFIPPLLMRHDTEQFEPICYLTSTDGDDEWEKLRALNPAARDVRRLSTLDVARQVRADNIDVLVNVSWEYRHRHIAVFGHRPAPIQIEMPLYPATTGHPETDFILTDRWICPTGLEGMYTEKVCRLDDACLPWNPPADAPEITPPPCLQNGFCTFGLFQKPSKLNKAVWDAICAVLSRVPDSQLLIHQNSDEIERVESPTRMRYVREMEARRVNAGRAIFVGARGHMEHLRTVALADIALDAFPYNGMTTTGDSLWMGVPVVTLTCETHAGRVGLSMLGGLGLPELAPDTREKYVEAAVSLASDLEKLTELRSELRPRTMASRIANASAAMSEIECQYRLVWRERCLREQRKVSRKDNA